MGEIIAGVYEIEEKIGSGGGGIVYLAKHMRLNKNVVLKADKRKITTHPEILRREVDALKNLSHTYIPTVYDYFMEDDVVYTVIDYIDGESLDKPLKRGVRFSQAQIIKWACQLLEALKYLHKPEHGNPPRGIVHSDIKPANIMLRENGDICLIDFNIALALGEENVVGLSAGYASPEHYGLDFSSDTSITGMSRRFDTEGPITGRIKKNKSFAVSKKNVYSIADNLDKQVDYGAETKDMEVMGAQNDSAETLALPDEEKFTVTMVMNQSQSTTGKKVIVPDVRSDIYSLGATLYHLFSGRRPAKNAVDVIPLSSADVSPQISAIIAKAMNPNPNLRYASAEEMLWAFTHLRESDIRTKQIKRGFVTSMVFSACILAAGIFSTFTGLKRMEAFQRAVTYAEYSANALRGGNTDGAVEYALEALPKSGLFIPSYIPEAQYALSNALGVYDLSDGYKSHMVLEMPSEVFKTVISPDGKTGVSLYAFEAAIFDTETGEIKAKLPIIESALSDVVFIDNEKLAYAGKDGLSVYDIQNEVTLWTGHPATHIAVSADGTSIAGLLRDETNAYLYDAKSGNENSIVNFEGKKQKVDDRDIFADPMDNIFKLSRDGKYLAVSFDDGGLTLFDTENADESILIFDTTDCVAFEGGFSGDYFAFSCIGEGKDAEGEFDILDIKNLEQTVGFSLSGRIRVKASESGIYLSNLNTAVKIDPQTGEQHEAAFTDSDMVDFNVSGDTFATVTKKNEFLFYNDDAKQISNIPGGDETIDFIFTAGDHAIAAGRNDPQVRIFKRINNGDKDIANYDKDYLHSEARISPDGSKIMLFNYKSFRIYSKDGTLINETEIPDADNVYDQQYSKESGNLEVIYNDALRIYSGETGEMIFEKTDLKSVKYASYGVSILCGDGTLKLISDTAEEVFSQNVKGDFAAYCGMVVDSTFAENRELIGSTKNEKGYFFALSDKSVCSIYDGEGNKLFEVPDSNNSEAFFTDNAVIISPLGEAPVAYSLKNGKKISELEKDAYLTYITPAGSYVISSYVSTTEGIYGILLDNSTYKPIAYLPKLTDVYNNSLVFDYGMGKLRTCRIYSIDELIAMAERRKIL